MLRAIAGFGSAERFSPSALLLFFLGVGAAGAAGGAVYYATDGLRAGEGWRRSAANVLTLLAYALVAFGLLVVVLSAEQ
jgi:hypothetical protein